MGADAVQAAVAALRAAHDELAALPIDLLTKPELVGVLDELETLSCQLPAQSHRMLARLQTETTAKEMGAKSWRQVLAIRWRISTSEAGRRLDEAAAVGAAPHADRGTARSGVAVRCAGAGPRDDQR